MSIEDPTPVQRAAALWSPASPIAVLERCAHHPSAMLAMNRMTRHFEVPGVDGLIAYRPSGGWWFQIGSAYAAPEDKAKLVGAFLEAARRERKRVCGIQLRREDFEVYGQAGFRFNQLGMSYSLDLTQHTLKGTKFMKLRNKIKRARREGVEVVELGADAERSPQTWARLEALTEAWLGTKGRGAKLLEFMVGELAEPEARWRRLFVGMRAGRVVGFISYVPAFGRAQGWMHDLSRRMPDAPPGVMELINATAMERFVSEGAPRLHFGLTPFLGVDEAHDNAPGRSEVVSWLVKQLALRGQAIYPARTQVAYKSKWRPTIIEPEFIAYQGRFRLSCLWQLLKVTQSI